MSQKKLADWLKVMIVGVGICGVLLAVFVLPVFGGTILTLGLLTGIPCYIALVFSWRIMTNIGNDQSFTSENGKLLKKISVLAISDVVFLFAWNLILFLVRITQLPGFLVCLVIDFLGIVIALIFAALSHLVGKAADLQEQSDLTI